MTSDGAWLESVSVTAKSGGDCLGRDDGGLRLALLVTVFLTIRDTILIKCAWNCGFSVRVILNSLSIERRSKEA